MTQIELDDDAAQAVHEIAQLRGVDDGVALAEAIGFQREIARQVRDGYSVLIAKKGKPTTELVFNRAR
jgi:hypothetical protein